MTTYLIILPHQLFAEHPGLDEKPDVVVLFEDPLFFGDPVYPAHFHKQKLWIHTASMEAYRQRLEAEGFPVTKVPYAPDAYAIDKAMADLAASGVRQVAAADPCDFIALKRLRRATAAADLQLRLYLSPGFINSGADNQRWKKDRSRWFMAEYYKYQRRRLNLLMDGENPAGGRWSFDEANRKKVPKAELQRLPAPPSKVQSDIDVWARERVLSDFPNAPGSLETLYLPTTHEEAALWLDNFLVNRLEHFGDYEDAIVEGESWLWHSVLTPALNSGLLTPQQVLSSVIEYAEAKDVPLNSLEGFVRQVVGWREFMRATYDDLGVEMRTSNHWNHARPMPKSFYDGTTGIGPIDDVIGRVLTTGYCHHIERLMVLGGFMFLCEIKPTDVYTWFMEMFVDSYDWVMVPNVYAMSQHADGGLITTKPYFSGSNYIRKMSHWKLGEWSDVWDGLYWRFIWKHRETLASNPRWAMMCRSVEKMDPGKRETHLANADRFLSQLQ